MITNQMIQNCIEEWSAVSKTVLCVYELNGRMLVNSGAEPDRKTLDDFIESGADTQTAGDWIFLRVQDDSDPVYVLAAKGAGDTLYMTARMVGTSLKALSRAYRERVDKDNFYQNLILDNMLLVDVYNRAKKLRIENVQNRLVYLIEVKGSQDTFARELLKGMFAPQNGDAITSVDEDHIILIKTMKENPTEEEKQEIADTIVSLLNTEAMLKVHVSYGSVVAELKDVSKSFKEASVAMEVGRIFYAQREVISFASLGIGRLIYQLPKSLCEIFIQEIFGGDIPELDEETLNTLDRFFENNLNVSETARQLFVHRNTLMYRIEKIQKSTGLDLRSFDDALTFKIALMVEAYLEYLETTDSRL